MWSALRPAAVLYLALTLLCGVVYPLAVHVCAQTLMPARANGSWIERDGHVVGSRWIGQEFRSPRYFWGRPSATTPHAYDASASTGSNLGPTNPLREQALRARVAELRNSDPASDDPIPADLVTSSASGLDPHISPAAARWQVARVARARGLDPSAVLSLVESRIERRTFGILGEPRVDVLELNLALDELH